jgi:hypothetical protein
MLLILILIFNYRNFISNDYSYILLTNDIFYNPDSFKSHFIPQISTTYRCRLRGIAYNSDNKYYYKSNKNYNLNIKISQLINLVNGWIICNISDIDVYNRLLVDIFIVTSTHIINLKDFILEHMKNEQNPIYSEYYVKKY